MTQSELNTTVDLSYGRITEIVAVVKKHNKGHVFRAQKALYEGMNVSKEIATPEKSPVTPVATEGKAAPLAKAVRDTETIINNLSHCIDATKDKDLKKALIDTVDALKESLVITGLEVSKEEAPAPVAEVANAETEEAEESLIVDVPGAEIVDGAPSAEVTPTPEITEEKIS